MGRQSSEAGASGLTAQEAPAQQVGTAPAESTAKRVLARVQTLGGSLVLWALAACVWLCLLTWQLDRVPGMSMDEGWSIISTRGQWPPANPLSGMSSYTGVFPVLLLRLFGTSSGLLVLRGASVVANGIAFVLIVLMLRRQYAPRALGWALPLIATCPVWLVAQRTGIEVTMFTTPLCVLGLYLFTRGAGWWAFAAGVAWGLLVYNHLLGTWALASFGLAWIVVYRRLLPPTWKPLFAGFCVGLLPRLIALALYDDEQITGLVTAHSPAQAIADLRWLPGLFWDTLSGKTVYLRYVGRVAVEIWPYWLLALVMLLPWIRHWRAVPRHVWFTLVAVVVFCILATVAVPYMAVRFFVLPAVGVSALVALLGAAAIELDPRWRHAVRAAAGLLVLGNLYYVINNFYLPWHRQELGMTSFFFGARSPRMGSWVYLPKQVLERELRQLSPAPEQILSNASLARPLRALLDDTGIRVANWEEGDRMLQSVLVDYRFGRPPPRRCVPTPGGSMCFRKPVVIDRHFVLYRR